MLALSGQLGSAQLGAAELGQLSSDSVGAGFPMFFPDSGPLKTAEPPKKTKAKKPKKVKKPKKPKRVKVKASALPTPAPVVLSAVAAATPEPASVLSTAVTQALQEELYRQARLRETITEDDELLLMLLC